MIAAPEGSSRSVWAAVLIAFALGVGQQLLTGGPNPQTGEPRAFTDVVATVVILAAAAGLMFGLLPTLARRGDRRFGPFGLAAAVVALLSLPALMWSGGSMMIGLGAFFLASSGLREAREADRPRVISGTGLVLGGAVALLNAAFLVYLSIADFNPGLPG